MEKQTPKPGTQAEPPALEALSGAEIPPVEPDYKKKFGESTNENQRILQDNAQLLREKAELESKLRDSQQTLSEQELKDKYPAWDSLSPDEQKILAEDFEKDKRLKVLEAKEKWRDDYAKLPVETKAKIAKKGGEETFKDFACSLDNRGQTNLSNLAKQFLYEEPAETPPSTPAEEVHPGLETGTGGGTPPPPKKEGFTAIQAAEMRIKDPKKYAKLVAEGRMTII